MTAEKVEIIPPASGRRWPFSRKSAAPESVADFVAAIRSQWRESVAGIIRVGALLIDAKARLDHGQFEAMVGGQLPFAPPTARKLMAIARDQRIAKRSQVNDLPASWGTLYALSQLSDAEFESAEAEGIITPDVERGTIENIKAKRRRVERIASISGQSNLTAHANGAPLVAQQAEGQPAEAMDSPALGDWAGDRKWPIILADPPWKFEDPPHGHTGRAIENHYPTMTLPDICAQPVSEIVTDTAALILWATAPGLAAALKTVEAWEFNYRTCAIWDKELLGMGWWFRNQHEIIIVATRGEFPPPVRGEQPGSIFKARRTAHSEKPPTMHHYLDQHFGELRKLELHARLHPKAYAPQPQLWDAWGKPMPVPPPLRLAPPDDLQSEGAGPTIEDLSERGPINVREGDR